MDTNPLAGMTLRQREGEDGHSAVLSIDELPEAQLIIDHSADRYEGVRLMNEWLDRIRAYLNGVAA